MRSVEHVCDEVKTHLTTLASQAPNTEVKHQLEERTHHLQEHIDDAAELLLRQVGGWTNEKGEKNVSWYELNKLGRLYFFYIYVLIWTKINNALSCSVFNVTNEESGKKTCLEINFKKKETIF